MPIRRHLGFINETKELASIYESLSRPYDNVALPDQWDEAVLQPSPSDHSDTPASQSRTVDSPGPDTPQDYDGAPLPLVCAFQSPEQYAQRPSSSSYGLSPEHLQTTNEGATPQVDPAISRNQFAHRPSAESLVQTPQDLFFSPVAGPDCQNGADRAGLARFRHADTIASLDTDQSTVLDDVGMPLRTSIWPLEDTEEARLLRYFVQDIANAFDLTDVWVHFKNVIPQRAGECPILLYAMLSAAARRLSRMSDYNPEVSEHYHQACLRLLIPLSNEPSAVLDETKESALMSELYVGLRSAIRVVRRIS